MSDFKKPNLLFLSVCLFLGLSSLGYQLGNAAIKFREYERTVTVKGLSEREYEADIVIWPIQFTVAGNNLTEMYKSIDRNTTKIRMFLQEAGIDNDEITFSSPDLIDKLAQEYVIKLDALRYTASQTVTVYSTNIKVVKKAMGEMSDLGQQGIVFTKKDYYQSQIEYIFTRLNEIKPEMIEEATRKAREVAEKFALDSKSTLGKIRSASQGLFSINSRDRNNPHIKKIRVVSTISYYLSD